MLSGCAPLLAPRTTWAGEEQKDPGRSGPAPPRPPHHDKKKKKKTHSWTQEGGLSPQTQTFSGKILLSKVLKCSEEHPELSRGVLEEGAGCVLGQGGPQALSWPFPFFLTALWGLREMCSPVHLGLPPPPPAHPAMQHGVRNRANTLDLQGCLLRDLGCSLARLHPSHQEPSEQKDGNTFLPAPLLCFHDPVQASPARGMGGGEPETRHQEKQT